MFLHPSDPVRARGANPFNQARQSRRTFTRSQPVRAHSRPVSLFLDVLGCFGEDQNSEIARGFWQGTGYRPLAFHVFTTYLNLSCGFD